MTLYVTVNVKKKIPKKSNVEGRAVDKESVSHVTEPTKERGGGGK
jgi:hypothetical protein